MKQSSSQKKNKNSSIFTIFLFLLIVIGCYVLFSIISPARTLTAFKFGTKLLTQLTPVILLVFTLIFVINLFIKPNWIQKHVGHDSGLKGMATAMISGIIAMGPIYIWYSLLKDFQQKGMKPSLIAIFFYSRSVKIPLLPLMIHYFGPAYTFVLTFYMLLFSLPNGLLTEWLTNTRQPDDFSKMSRENSLP